MKIATVREVQHDLKKVLAWVEEGEEVLVTRRNKTIAKMVPCAPEMAKPGQLPDFAGRARQIWGAKAGAKSLSDAILAERGERV